MQNISTRAKTVSKRVKVVRWFFILLKVKQGGQCSSLTPLLSPLSPQDQDCYAITNQTKNTNHRHQDSFQDHFCHDGISLFTLTLLLFPWHPVADGREKVSNWEQLGISDVYYHSSIRVKGKSRMFRLHDKLKRNTAGSVFLFPYLHRTFKNIRNIHILKVYSGGTFCSMS